MWWGSCLRDRNSRSRSQCVKLDGSVVSSDAFYYHSYGRHEYSKKSKIQSHGLAPAILEGLMPIACEEEAEDIDDDTPSRVRLLTLQIKNIAYEYPSLRFASSTVWQLPFLQA